MSVGNECVVDDLDIAGVKPYRGPDARLSNGCEVGAGNDTSKCERDRRRLEDDCMRRARLRTDETEVLLIERLRRVEVASLERDEVRAGDGHRMLLSLVSVI